MHLGHIELFKQLLKKKREGGLKSVVVTFFPNPKTLTLKDKFEGEINSKDEKINLLHIAICKLLSRYGYYQYVGKDKDGWPHWKTNSELPRLKPGEQTILMKEAAVFYFNESDVEL